MISNQMPMGLSACVVELCSVAAPTSLLRFHGTAASAVSAPVAFGADLPGPPRGAPV